MDGELIVWTLDATTWKTTEWQTRPLCPQVKLQKNARDCSRQTPGQPSNKLQQQHYCNTGIIRKQPVHQHRPSTSACFIPRRVAQSPQMAGLIRMGFLMGEVIILMHADCDLQPIAQTFVSVRCTRSREDQAYEPNSCLCLRLKIQFGCRQSCVRVAILKKWPQAV